MNEETKKALTDSELEQVTGGVKATLRRGLEDAAATAEERTLEKTLEVRKSPGIDGVVRVADKFAVAQKLAALDRVGKLAPVAEAMANAEDVFN